MNNALYHTILKQKGDGLIIEYSVWEIPIWVKCESACNSDNIDTLKQTCGCYNEYGQLMDRWLSERKEVEVHNSSEDDFKHFAIKQDSRKHKQEHGGFNKDLIEGIRIPSRFVNIDVIVECDCCRFAHFVDDENEMYQELATLVFSFAGKDSSDLIKKLKEKYQITRK